MTPEQRLILASRPLERVRLFSSMLNWRGLQLGYTTFTHEQIAKWNVPRAGILFDYMSTDMKFNIQINELWDREPITHQATIKAERYRIFHIGWHPFTLFEDDEALKREAERLRPWLDRRLYRNRKWLREVKREHLEMLPSKYKHSRKRWYRMPPQDGG